MQDQINTLIEDIKEDYAMWTSRRDEKITPWLEQMIKEFNEGLSFKAGKKYIKIMSKGSVWGFVVNVDNDNQFRKGDILKPAGWAAPTRNFARGNIISGGYKISWTGTA